MEIERRWLVEGWPALTPSAVLQMDQLGAVLPDKGGGIHTRLMCPVGVDLRHQVYLFAAVQQKFHHGFAVRLHGELVLVVVVVEGKTVRF